MLKKLNVAAEHLAGVREILPALKDHEATDIIELPIAKIVH